MTQFEDETQIEPIGDGLYRTHLTSQWSIGTNPNGGYALTPLLRALADSVQQPHPMTLTTHFLRPCVGDTDATIHVETIRVGRGVSTVRGELEQQGKTRLAMLASFTDLDVSQGVADTFAPPAPELPPVESCVHRSDLEQGVEIPLLARTDVYVAPHYAHADSNREAMIEGWIRLSDRTEPDVFSLPLCLDAFPPSAIARLSDIGWVPTMELTVHVRRRPQPGWLRGRFHCDDLQGGRMVESGILWDASGAVVARSRQVGLILNRVADT